MQTASTSMASGSHSLWFEEEVWWGTKLLMAEEHPLWLRGEVSMTLLVVDPLRVFVPISNLVRDGFHEVDPFE
jgi:hypothetical protein